MGSESHILTYENKKEEIVEYTIEELIATFEENSCISKKNTKQSLSEFKKNNIGCPIPAWFVEEFNINDALSSMCKEILKLKQEIKMVKESRKEKNKVKKVMHEMKEGSLHSGSKKGPVVKNPKKGIAIALSEAGLSKNKK